MAVDFFPLNISEVRHETPDSISLAFEIPSALEGQFAFRAGQHVTLRQHISGEEFRRNYSLCVAPQDGEFRIAVKRIPGGRFSNWANDHLQPGMVIDVMPPHGSFVWNFTERSERNYLVVAGGSGITPLMSLIRAGLKASDLARFTLLYGNRQTASIMFLEALADLKNRFMDRLAVYHFLEEEEDEDFPLFNGRLDAAKMTELAGGLVDPAVVDLAFICGPGAMIEAVESALKSAGLDGSRIMVERFTAGVVAGTDGRSVRVQGTSGVTTQVQAILDGRRRSFSYDPAKGSILENARAAGLETPFACKAGVCATCRAKLVAGEVEMIANYALSAEELAQGYVLTCQAVPKGDGVVLDFGG